MNEIIIIAFGYEGVNSNNANSICLFKIIKYLSSRLKIRLVTSTFEVERLYFDETDNITIHRIPYHKKANGEIDFKNWKARVIAAISKYDITNYSKLLTLSFPFPLLRVGYEIKKKFEHLDWYVYELDPYAYNRILRYPYLLFFYRAYQELKIFNKAEKILLTHELYNTYNKSMYKFLSYKFEDVGIPLLEIHDNYTLKNKSENIKISFIGALYRKVRDPEYILSLISEIKDTHIHFYGSNPKQISEKSKKKLNDRLIMHGRIPKDDIEAVLKDSDILLNIGNNVNNQLPSKVLEYIGTGKPILNVYRISDDTSNLYLKKYPNALLIDQSDNIEYNIKSLNDFISKDNPIIDSKELSKIYENDTIAAVAERVAKIVTINNNKECSK